MVGGCVDRSARQLSGDGGLLAREESGCKKRPYIVGLNRLFRSPPGDQGDTAVEGQYRVAVVAPHQRLSRCGIPRLAGM